MVRKGHGWLKVASFASLRGFRYFRKRVVEGGCGVLVEEVG